VIEAEDDAVFSIFCLFAAGAAAAEASADDIAASTAAGGRLLPLSGRPEFDDDVLATGTGDVTDVTTVDADDMTDDVLTTATDDGG
jgi:hypothetical protein